MQAVYRHTTTAELTQAADRARVLIHKNARSIWSPTEPCPNLWFAEMCYASDYLDLTPAAAPRDVAYATYFAKAKELLDAGGGSATSTFARAIENRPVGMSLLGSLPSGDGRRLGGIRKVRWKPA